MKRLSASLLICIIMFSACTTTGGNVPAPVDRTTMLIEALATSPTGEVVEEEKETITPAKEIVKEPSSPVKTEETAEEKLPESVEETVINPPVEVSEPENEIIVQEAEQPAAVEEASDAEVPLVIPFEEAKEDEIATSPSPDENADIIPVSGESGDAEPILYPVAPSSRPSINMAEDNMAPWMISLMIILVVIMVLYTASSAIRNAYKAPLNRFVAVAIALLLTALSWVLSYIILGPSLLYLAYLALLGTYFVLRSTKRSDHE